MKKTIEEKVKLMNINYSNAETRKIQRTDLEKLPKLMKNYFIRTNLIGSNIIHAVRLKQEGVFKMNPDSDWTPYTAEQYVNVKKNSFIWYAKMKLFSFVNIHVVDEYIKGKGRLYGKLFSLLKVVDEKGPEMDQGEILRFLGEAIWYPTFYLKNSIRWEELDENLVKITLSLESEEISGKLLFNKEGFIKEFRANRYYNDKNGLQLKPWRAIVENYEKVNGHFIPRTFKVGWHLDRYEFYYIKARITNIEYNSPNLY